MRTLRTFGNLNDAFLAQSWLDSCGVRTLIPDENTATGSLPYVSIYSGIRLQVEEEDYEKAHVMLGDFAVPAEAKSPPLTAPITMSKSAARALFILDFILLVLYFLYFEFAPSPFTPEFEEYVSSFYLSHAGAWLVYYIGYPLYAYYALSSLSLVLFQNWGRYLYLAGWGFAVFSTTFTSAQASYGIGSFLQIIGTLLGGFICCLIFFSPAARYFKKVKPALLEKSEPPL